MPSYSKTVVIGHLGRDPELKSAKSGLAICNLSVATTYKSSASDKEITEWHKVIVFQKQAENCGKYLKKGSLVLVEGRNQTRKWQDKEGVERYTTEIVADRVLFLDGKKSGNNANADYGKQDSVNDESDIPF